MDETSGVVMREKEKMVSLKHEGHEKNRARAALSGGGLRCPGN
ncbi:MAG TPA: hypothetical protein VLD55_14005 [Candidatus Sulfobium mesophilum]|nr:hypothetical protein [Candidatus Sulfobium mesophilum]